MKRPLILVSNDDGYKAPGVHKLVKTISAFADVVAVCPEGPQSGKSMAITVSEPLRVRRVTGFDSCGPAVEWYAVNGTPVDCVKIAMHTILGERRPALACTGINHGSNAAINVLYSGTMGAAFEAATFGVPAIGFSLCDHSMEADFMPMLPYVEKMARLLLATGLPEEVALNLNAPVGELKGLRLTRGCRGHWSDEYKRYLDPSGKPFYMLTGNYVNDEPDNPDTDDAWLSKGYVSVVACGLERTVELPAPLAEAIGRI